jgi:hypothetical protein
MHLDWYICRVPEGSHSLTIFLEGFNQKYHEPRFVSYTDTIYFSIDLTAPNISILSPENKTYTVTSNITADVPLDFTTDEDDSQVTYRLDGQNAVPIAENTTLIGLPVGSHNLTMYVQDLAGNTGVSETVNFTIAPETGLKSDSMPELLPIVAAASASAAVVALAGVVADLQTQIQSSLPTNLGEALKELGNEVDEKALIC